MTDFIDLFPTRMVRRQLPDFEEPNRDLIKLVRDMEKGNKALTTDYRENNPLEYDREGPNWLRAQINQTVIDYLRETGINYPVNWQIHAWANINRTGHSNEFHVHPGCYWSGVYYVDDGGCAADKTLGGEFVIMDPRGPGPSMYAPTLCFQGPGGNSVGATELLSPRTGIMLMFPSWLSHGVRPYHGTEERISIAFNLAVAP